MRIEHSDSSTLDGVRYILTIKNQNNRPLIDGPLIPDTEVICLRRNDSGYYLPCLAYVVKVGKRVTVDLYRDRSERVTVTRKAILWPDASNKPQANPVSD